MNLSIVLQSLMNFGILVAVGWECGCFVRLNRFSTRWAIFMRDDSNVGMNLNERTRSNAHEGFSLASTLARGYARNSLNFFFSKGPLDMPVLEVPTQVNPFFSAKLPLPPVGINHSYQPVRRGAGLSLALTESAVQFKAD